MWVREAAVAGRFYPAEDGELREQVRAALAEAHGVPGLRLKALIVPHAGYVYSGPIAATGYASLQASAASIDRVVLLGTCHSPGVEGLAATSATAFQTPLGDVEVDEAAVAEALRFPQVQVNDPAHLVDHALEVQLPFLQAVLGRFRIVPFLVGRVGAGSVAEVLDRLWDGDSTILDVSSDLSHYRVYEEARRLDQATARAIEDLDEEALGPRSACGRDAIAGLVQAARGHGLRCRTLDLRNSGDTAGRRDRVVGYGAFAFFAEVPGGEAADSA
jgi:AmmeMemoRadiSam system protein B